MFQRVCKAILIVLVVICWGNATANAQHTYRYGYIVVDGTNERMSLFTVDPYNLASQIVMDIDILKPSKAALRNVIPSPDGHWIVLPYRTNEEDIIYMLNTQTQAISQIAHGGLANVVSAGSPTDVDQRFAWSPDSRYVAFSLTNQQGAISLYLFSVAEHKLIRIAVTSVHYPRIAWSQDSTLLVIETSSCTQLECDANISTFDVDSEQVLATIKLGAFYPASVNLRDFYAAEPDKMICQLTVSPNKDFVAFVSICPGSRIIGSRREVYLWKVGLYRPAKITRYTENLISKGTIAVPLAFYTLHWRAKETLLIGATYGGEGSGFLTQSVAVSATTLNQTLLSEHAIKFVANAGQQEHLIILESDIQSYYADPRKQVLVRLHTLDVMENMSLQNIEAFSDKDNQNALCDIAISPNAQFIAYIQRAESRCSGRAEKLTVMSLSTGEELSFDFPAFASVYNRVISVGWLTDRQ
jgi:hypothetical protein